jgi:hypothetical protein
MAAIPKANQRNRRMVSGPVAAALAGGLERAQRLLGVAIDSLADARRVTRFAGQRLLFQPRPDDIYIVTYPRSGTTWMQLMTHMLVRGGDLDFEHISDVSPWFERSLAVGTLTAQDLEQRPSPRVFKSHLAHGWIPTPSRVIYVARDGAQVAHSYFRFYRDYLRFDGDFDRFLRRFVAGDLQYGSWFRHVERWRRFAVHEDVLWIDYDELCTDPVRELGRVARFCGLEASLERLAEIVAASSRARMKAHEVRFDHATVVLRERGIDRGRFVGSRPRPAVRLSKAQQESFERARSQALHSGRQHNIVAFLR